MVVKFKITETEKAFYPAIFTKNVTLILIKISLRKKMTFCDATDSFPAKRRLRNERRNSILLTNMHHYPDLGN